MKILLLIALAFSCISPTSGNALRPTPIYELPKDAKADLKAAVELIERYGNSDEFYEYVKRKRKYFSHTELSRDQAIEGFRNSLERQGKIKVIYYEEQVAPELENLGVWDSVGSRIKQNRKFILTPEQRAAHLLHETTHAYGYIHKGNDYKEHDNLNSFPYSIGFDFYKFLQTKKALWANSKT